MGLLLAAPFLLESRAVSSGATQWSQFLKQHTAAPQHARAGKMDATWGNSKRHLCLPWRTRDCPTWGHRAICSWIQSLPAFPFKMACRLLLERQRGSSPGWAPSATLTLELRLEAALPPPAWNMKMPPAPVLAPKMEWFHPPPPREVSEIVETSNGRGWKGPQRSSNFNPPKHFPMLWLQLINANCSENYLYPAANSLISVLPA